MLAPPDKRRRKRKPVAERRADDRRRKRLQLKRENQDLHRVELWLSGRAIAGVTRQLIYEGRLTDEQALDHRNFEIALAALVEKQGAHWAR